MERQQDNIPAVPEERCLSINEPSEFLKISMSTPNRLIKQNRIPSYKIGDRGLFEKDELIKWMKTHRGDGQDSSESQLPQF
jgi:excisionase family DNA binding protein